MKERTYGWYPPARDIWDTRKEASSYHKECLYKHLSSRFNDQSGVATPQPPSPIRAFHAPTTSRPKSTRPPSRSSFRKAPATPPPQQHHDLAISGFRPPSVGSLRQVTSSSKPRSTKPRKAWATQTSATAVTSVPHFQPFPSSPAPSESRITIDKAPDMSGSHRHCRPNSGQSNTSSRRSMSASMYRQKASQPPRPTKSAGSLRAQSKNQELEVSPSGDTEDMKVPSPPTSPEMSRMENCQSLQRPGAPVPLSEEDERSGEEEESVDGSQPDEDGQRDYEEQLAKYGWRFEIPGDPFNLKRPTLPPRLPYTVKVPVPEVAPNPPTGHMMNYDTYFLNTIPRKPMTFTIHKEWISEVLHAKRMDLQKKEGTNYNYKQYAFIY